MIIKLRVCCSYCNTPIETEIKFSNHYPIVSLSQFKNREWACVKCNSVTSVHTNLCGYTADILAKSGKESVFNE